MTAENSETTSTSTGQETNASDNTTQADTNQSQSSSGEGTTTETKSEGDESGKGNESQDKKTDETFTVTLPEGTQVEKEVLEAYTLTAKEAGLNSEQASKLAGFYAEQRANEAKAWEKQGKEWAEQLKNDEDFGGKNLEANLAAKDKAIQSLPKELGEQVRETFEAYGLGNLPPMVKALAYFGKALSEDKTGTDGSKDSNKKPLSPQEILNKRFPPEMGYGNT